MRKREDALVRSAVLHSGREGARGPWRDRNERVREDRGAIGARELRYYRREKVT